MDWQPIETAPKDGKLILLAPHMITAVWDWAAENWCIADLPLDADMRITPEVSAAASWYELMVTFFGGEPTHWMPLPAPPP